MQMSAHSLINDNMKKKLGVRRVRTVLIKYSCRKDVTLNVLNVKLESSDQKVVITHLWQIDRWLESLSRNPLHVSF